MHAPPATPLRRIAAASRPSRSLAPVFSHDIGATPTTSEFVCVRVTSGVVSHVVCALYFTGLDLRPCLPFSPTYTMSLIVSPRSWSRCSSLATSVFIWSKPTTRQSVNLTTCSPTMASRIIFPPKNSRPRWPTLRRCIPRRLAASVRRCYRRRPV